MVRLVARHCLRSRFFCLRRRSGVAISISIAIAVSIPISRRRSDRNGLEVCRNRFSDIGHAANWHDCWLRLLEHQFFVDGANFSLFLNSLLAANTILFRGRQGDVVLQVANARSIISVDDQRVFE